MAPYVLDFYCEELKLAIELDGGQHNADDEVRRDAKRETWLKAKDITVVRYWNHEFLLRTTDAMEDLSRRIGGLRSRPSSGASRHLLPEGEGTLDPLSLRERGRGEGV